MDQIGPNHRLVNFRLFYLITQMIGVTLIILMISWVGIHLGGLGWNHNAPKIMFNWHPILMTIGMVFLYGNSILIYRAFRYSSKKSLKITHACIHGGAFIFTAYALLASFNSHNYNVPPIANLYSLHSWIGILAVILFAFQYVFGFACYLFPTVREPLKIFYMPIHVFFGLFGFILALVASLMGLTEKAFFRMPDGAYSALPNEGVLVNCIGLLIVAFGTMVVYLVTEPTYKREPLPEDSLLLLSNEE